MTMANDYFQSILLFVFLCSIIHLISSQSQTNSNQSSLVTSEAPPVANYLCDSDDKLVTDVWSINNVIYLKVLHYKNDSRKEIDSRIFIYDVQQNKFLNVFHISSSSQSPSITQSDSNYLKDVIGRTLLKGNVTSHTPSIVYFGPRQTLRSRCQSKWLYVPPSSQFCRYHPIVNNLYRVVAIIGQNGPNIAQVEMYRMMSLRDDFTMTTLRPITQNEFRADQRRDVLEQYITSSLLTLQLNHHIMPPPHQNVRFIFSNNLGLFISWYPSTFANFENDLPVNCAVMMPIKNKPYIKVCSQRYNFVSFIELNQTLYVVLPENQMIILEHDYIKKQYRIMNNLHIDLDRFEPVNIFKEFFKCKQSPPSKRLFKNSIKFLANRRQLIKKPGRRGNISPKSSCVNHENH